MNRGVPPTELNARTGEFTPPGTAAFARSNHAFDCSVPLLTRPVSQTSASGLLGDGLGGHCPVVTGLPLDDDRRTRLEVRELARLGDADSGRVRCGHLDVGALRGLHVDGGAVDVVDRAGGAAAAAE